MSVYFITGTSSGFGKAIARAALEAGHEVALTARNPQSVQDLLQEFPDACRAYALDVTDAAQVNQAIAEAAQDFGQLDVVVNNAGYGLMGALEEASDAQIERCVQTNFLGSLAVLRAALPHLRAQKSGHIVQISAIAALANHAGFSVYGGAKAAIEAACDALKIEVAPLGIKVTVVSPGPYRTEFIRRSQEKAATHVPDYDATSGKFAAYLDKIDGKQPGDPSQAAQLIVQMVAEGKSPARLFLGKYALDAARKSANTFLKDAADWEQPSLATDFPR